VVSENTSRGSSTPEKIVQVTKVYDDIRAATTKTVLCEGGVRSSKSYSFIQRLIEFHVTQKNKQILMLRKNYPSAKRTIELITVKLLKEYGIYRAKNHNKTYHQIEYPPSGSTIVFAGLDEQQKIKSTEWHHVFMEEGNEFTKEDYIWLGTRLSGPIEDGEINQIFISINPVDQFGWINTWLKKQIDVTTLYSTYKDNPFLSQQFIDTLEALKDQDENAYRIAVLGEYAQGTHIIYPPFLMDLWPGWAAFDKDIWYGIDFGWAVPTCVLEFRTIQKEEGKLPEVYVRELIYETELNNQDLIGRLNRLIKKDQRDRPIYCDPSAPAYIDELVLAGFNATPGDNDVENGIDFCKRLKVHSLPQNEGFNKERERYMYRVDRRTGEVVDDKPVKFNDHAMDAFRYGGYTHLSPLQQLIPSLTMLKDGVVSENVQVRYAEIDHGLTQYPSPVECEIDRDRILNDERAWTRVWN